MTINLLVHTVKRFWSFWSFNSTEQSTQYFFRLSHKIINAKNINYSLNETVNVRRNFHDCSMVDNSSEVMTRIFPLIFMLFIFCCVPPDFTICLVFLAQVLSSFYCVPFFGHSKGCKILPYIWLRIRKKGNRKKDSRIYIRGVNFWSDPSRLDTIWI
jgi:hypothetical protein